MVIQSLPLSPCLSSSLLPTVGLGSRSTPPARVALSTPVRCSSRSYPDVTKNDDFNRRGLDGSRKILPSLRTLQTLLADYCSILEGDARENCWKAYLDLQDIEKVSEEEMERIVAGAMSSLIDYINEAAEIRKCETEIHGPLLNEEEERRLKSFPVPDELPRPMEEIEEEQKMRMQDSPYTRLLRSKGLKASPPAWYTPRPDHETD